MSFTASPIANVKAGTCPHGLPLGACPICNGMGGGSSIKRQENKPKEMSWNECYAIGQMMKLQKANALANKDFLEAQALAKAQFQQNINALVQKFNNTLTFIQNNAPLPIAKAISVSTNIIKSTINFITNAFQNIRTQFQDIKAKLADITDKLTAMFGEKFNALEKNIKDKIGTLKKKLKSIFGIEEIDETENEREKTKKVEEDKRTFETKYYLQNIFIKEVEKERDK